MSAIASGDLCYCIGRSVVYVGGYFYAFYYRTTDGYLCYRSSSDGENWSSEVALWAIGRNDGYAVYTDGTYIYVAYGTPTYGSSPTASTAYTVRGTPSAGTITWASPITVRQASGYWLFSWAKTANRVYLALVAYNTTSQAYHVHVYYNSDGNSAWTEILDSTTLTDSGYRAGICICDLPQYTDGIMLVAAKFSANTLTYKVYDGSAWGADTSFGSKTFSRYVNEISMAAMSGQVHLAVIPATGGGTLRYYYYTTSWSSATTVDSSTCMSPCLAATSSKLYVFYAIDTNILYRTMDYSTHTWSSATTLASNQTSPNMINTERYPSEQIGVLWRQGTASPYSIMFSYVPPGVAYTTLTESLGCTDSTVKASSVVKRELPGLQDMSNTGLSKSIVELLSFPYILNKNAFITITTSLNIFCITTFVSILLHHNILKPLELCMRKTEIFKEEKMSTKEFFTKLVEFFGKEYTNFQDNLIKMTKAVIKAYINVQDVLSKLFVGHVFEIFSLFKTLQVLTICSKEKETLQVQEQIILRRMLTFLILNERLIIFEKIFVPPIELIAFARLLLRTNYWAYLTWRSQYAIRTVKKVYQALIKRHGNE